MELTYDDMYEFSKVVKPVIGDYHLRLFEPHPVDPLCLVLEKDDNWDHKVVYITRDKVKDILDHAAKF